MTHRRWVVPEVVQTSTMDCGPAALKALLAGHGVEVSYSKLREACQTTVDGTSINALEDLACALGLDAQQILIPTDHLLLSDSHALPCLVVQRLPTGVTHFVVLWSRIGPYLQVMDPERGRRWIHQKRFLESVYVHGEYVDPESWERHIRSNTFGSALARRMKALEIDTATTDALIASARSSGWRDLSALDAAVRFVNHLVVAKSLPSRIEPLHVVKELAQAAALDESALPPLAWTGRPSDDGRVIVRGAVALTVRGRNANAPDTSELEELETDASTHPQEPRSGVPAAELREDHQEQVPVGARLVKLMMTDGFAAPLVLLFALVAGSIGVIFEALTFRALLQLSNDLRLPEQRLALGFSLLALLILLLLLRLPTEAIALRLGRHLEVRLRRQLFEKIPRLSDRYFHSRLTSDLAERAHALHVLRDLPTLLIEGLRVTLEIAATVAALLWLYPQNVWVVLLSAACCVLLPLLLQPVLTERDLRVKTLFGALSQSYLDALMGVVALKAHAGERALRRNHEKMLLEWERSSRALLRASVGMDFVVATAGAIMTVVLLSTYLSHAGVAAGALLLVYWSLRVPALSRQLAHAAAEYPRIRNSAARLLEPLDAPEESNAAGRGGVADGLALGGAALGGAAPDEVAPDGAAPAGVAIRFSDVTLSAAGHDILSHVEVNVAAGEHVAIVGPSGAGKTTLVSLLLGWQSPSSGKILVDGEPLSGETVENLRRQTAWVDPTIQLWNRSLLQNLRYGAEASTQPLADVVEAAHLKEVIGQLPDGLQTQLGESGRMVSGGEGQRVRIGRAMMQQPTRLVLLDEPFRGLDRSARRALIHNVRAQFGQATLFFVSHDISDTEDFDRVLVVHRGKIIEDGNPRELGATRSLYQKLLEADRALRTTLWERGDFRKLVMEKAPVPSLLDGLLVDDAGLFDEASLDEWDEPTRVDR